MALRCFPDASKMTLQVVSIKKHVWGLELMSYILVMAPMIMGFNACEGQSESKHKVLLTSIHWRFLFTSTSASNGYQIYGVDILRWTKLGYSPV